MSIHISYWGSPFISASFLNNLIQDSRFIIDYIVTQPDKPRSTRGREILPSAVKKVGLKYNIPILTPTSLNDINFINEIEKHNPSFHVVFAYGKIIPISIFNKPIKGSVNFHASLLPLLRGAAPIEFSLMEGHNVTGWTLQKIDTKLDSGDILATITENIKWNDTKEILFQNLEQLLLQWGANTLYNFYNDKLNINPQNHENATYCSKIYSETGKLNWSKSVFEIRNLCRSLGKSPGVYTFWGTTKIKLFLNYEITKDEILNTKKSQQYGTIFLKDNINLWVICGDGHALPFLSIQLEGKKPILIKEFINGYLKNKEIIFT